MTFRELKERGAGMAARDGDQELRNENQREQDRVWGKTGLGGRE